MSKKTDDVITRGITWSEKDPDIAGLVLYGSVARGRSHASSDVDLVIITRTGKRDQVWNKRAKIATRLLDAELAWSHDLPWQGDYRFQAWRSDLLGVDLTIDDGYAHWHETFNAGQPTVVAGDVTLPAQTNHGRRRITPDMEVWVWFLGNHNQLQQDRAWDAYCQLIQLLNTRLRPLTDQTQLATLAPARHVGASRSNSTCDP